MRTDKPHPVLRDHRRRKKTLVPPLAELGVQMMEWEGIYLPEHLWLGYLMRDGDVSRAAARFNGVCDLLDSYFIPQDEGEIFLGYMSDFSRVSIEKRPEVVQRLQVQEASRDAFGADFRAVLALYPEGPAGWLALGQRAKKGESASLGLIRELVKGLRDPRSKSTVQCRILGLNRLLKHRRIVFSKKVVDDALAQGLARYPFTDEETSGRVEQFVRQAMNVTLSHRKLTNWAVQFWIANFMLVGCR